MTIHNDDTIAGRISRALRRAYRDQMTLPPRSRSSSRTISLRSLDRPTFPCTRPLRRLEAQGLAVSEPRRGVRVASFDLKEVQEVAKMRAALEGLALRHSAETPYSLAVSIRPNRQRSMVISARCPHLGRGQSQVSPSSSSSPARCRGCFQPLTTSMRRAPAFCSLHGIRLGA